MRSAAHQVDAEMHVNERRQTNSLRQKEVQDASTQQSAVGISPEQVEISAAEAGIRAPNFSIADATRASPPRLFAP
jgi:hypothetical protein